MYSSFTLLFPRLALAGELKNTAAGCSNEEITAWTIMATKLIDEKWDYFEITRIHGKSSLLNRFLSSYLLLPFLSKNREIKNGPRFFHTMLRFWQNEIWKFNKYACTRPIFKSTCWNFLKKRFVPYLLFIFPCTFCWLFAPIQLIFSICFIDDKIIMIDYRLLSHLCNKLRNKYNGVAATKM